MITITDVFPTKLAIQIAKRAALHELLEHDIDLPEVVNSFQCVAIVEPFEVALKVAEAQFNKKLNAAQRKELLKIYDLTKIEFDGIIAARFAHIITHGKHDANSLAAIELWQNMDGAHKSDNLKKVIFSLKGPTNAKSG